MVIDLFDYYSNKGFVIVVNCLFLVVIDLFYYYSNKGFVIDHIDGDTLNNSINNLRICKHEENLRNQKINKNNKSGFKGVYFCKQRNKFRAEIKKDRQKYFLGLFIDPKDAASAYNKAAIKFHGEFANLNKID